MIRNRRWVLTVVAGALSVGTGCLGGGAGTGSTTPAEPAERTITIANGEFSPASLQAAAGDDVTLVFANDDEQAYELVADFDEFDVTVDPGETVRQQLTVPSKPGTYEIACENSGGSFDLESVPEDLLRGCRFEKTDE